MNNELKNNIKNALSEYGIDYPTEQINNRNLPAIYLYLDIKDAQGEEDDEELFNYQLMQDLLAGIMPDTKGLIDEWFGRKEYEAEMSF